MTLRAVPAYVSGAGEATVHVAAQAEIDLEAHGDPIVLNISRIYTTDTHDPRCRPEESNQYSICKEPSRHYSLSDAMDTWSLTYTASTRPTFFLCPHPYFRLDLRHPYCKIVET